MQPPATQYAPTHSGPQTTQSGVTQTLSDTPLFYSYLALLFWLPLPLGSNRPWSAHLFEVLTFGLLICWLLHYLKHPALPTAVKKAKLPLICLFSFAGLTLIQLIPLPSAWVQWLRPVNTLLEPQAYLPISIDVYATQVAFKLSIAFAAFGFLTLALITNKARLKALALTFVVAGVCQAVFGSLMTLSGTEWSFFIPKQSYQGNATGTFINRNHLANYLVLCLAMGTGLLLADLYQNSANNWRERGRRFAQALLGNKIRVRIALALMVIALVLTRSRMGNTAFFFSLFTTGFLWLLLTKRVTKGSILLLISLIIIDTLIVGTWFGLEEVKQRMEASSIQSESRDEVNRDTWPLILSQPLLGSGAGTYYTAFPRYRQSDITMSYDQTHNDYFQFLVEYGVLGCLPLIVLVIASLLKTYQVLVKRKTLFFQALGFAPLMATIAMLLHIVVEFNLQIPANALSFMVILLLPWLLRYTPSKTTNKTKR